MKILFVCEGNMMRSQMAEAFYNTITNSSAATSAGAVAEAKDHISPRAITVMDELGIGTHSLRPKRLTPQMIEDAEKVILFPTEYMPEYAVESNKSEVWEVIDPHYHKEQGMELVRTVRDDIRERVTRLLND